MQHQSHSRRGSKTYIHKALQRLLKQKLPYIDSIKKTIQLCDEIATNRKNHIQAIETSKNRKIFDNMNEYQTLTLETETQGKDEYDDYIQNVEKTIFGLDNDKTMDTEWMNKVPKYMHLANKLPYWENLQLEENNNVTSKQIKTWYYMGMKSKRLLNNTVATIEHVHQEEWQNAKKSLYLHWQIRPYCKND
jgi:hypothetical protein